MIGLLVVGAAMQSQWLSASQLLESVDRFHPQVIAARADVDVARGKQREKTGAFDPVFSANTSRIRYNASSARGKEYVTDSTNAEIEFLTPGGPSVGVGRRLNLGNVKSPSSSTGTLGEYYVSLRIPLMRGNGLNSPSVAVAQAKTAVEIAEQDVNFTRLDIRQAALNAYWKTVAAQNKLKIARDLLELSATRRDQIRKRVEREDLPRIELTEAETEVLRREGEVIRAERVVQNARLELSLFGWTAEGAPATLGAVADRLSIPQASDGKEATPLEEEALKRRPEIVAIDLTRSVAQLDQDFARADRRPSLDLVFEPGYDFGQEAIGSTMKAGIYYSLPLKQNTVDGRIEQAKQRLEKISADRRLAEARIRTDVRDALSAVDAAFRRYQTVRAQVDIAAQLERGERIRYEAGDGTLFLLIQRENATAEARMRLVEANLDWQLSQVQLQVATGRLLQESPSA